MARHGPAAGEPRWDYVPGLDGLRAIALLAVLAFHQQFATARGGYLGVSSFFTLSGFLITSLAIDERRRTGRLSWRGFWERRARRLLPAAVVALVAVLVVQAWLTVGSGPRLRGDVLSAVAYVTNWRLVMADGGYADLFATPSPVVHFWSLAIEEQFYLVWPVVFLIGLALLRRRALVMAVVAGAILSSLLMAAMYEPLTDPSNVYYNTFTRLSGLLLGGALALVWDPARRAERPAEPGISGAATTGLGLIGAIGLGAIMRTTGEFDSFLYRGGFFLVGLTTCLLIVAATNERTAFASVLATAPMTWIGKRSYAIYLWHWPIVVFTRPDADIALHGMASYAYRIGLTLLLAELSYRLVEAPWRMSRRDRMFWRATRHR
ncbi:MAG TPA: acyltransferase, partial [Acidimicrobiales bacterium]|nr:acyltransferase [Acidimicrobiales bacterium]